MVNGAKDDMNFLERAQVHANLKGFFDDFFQQGNSVGFTFQRVEL